MNSTAVLCVVERYAEINRQPGTRHCSVSLLRDISNRYQAACSALCRLYVTDVESSEMYAHCDMSRQNQRYSYERIEEFMGCYICLLGSKLCLEKQILLKEDLKR
jgi:hypothetical protein